MDVVNDNIVIVSFVLSNTFQINTQKECEVYIKQTRYEKKNSIILFDHLIPMDIKSINLSKT